MSYHYVKCPKCEKTFNRDLEEAVQVKRRWYHKKCFEELEKEHKQREAVAVRQESVQTDKQELLDYIQELFGTNVSWPCINRQINSFVTKYNYSYREIYLSLLYFYEIKKGDISKANNRIGIVPFIHDEAIAHYSKISERQKQIANKMMKVSNEVKIIKIEEEETTRKNKVKEIDINNL